jgi:DNA-binding MarR family transcriptional regulator
VRDQGSRASSRRSTSASAPSTRRKDDLRRVEQAITRIGQIGGGKDAAKVREARSGITVSRPGIAIMAALARNGELRVGEIAHIAHLETPLVSRELNRLVSEGYALRQPDADDGRVARVILSERGLAAYKSYRQATDDIIAETFSEWRSDELRVLASNLERVLSDFARPRSVV